MIKGIIQKLWIRNAFKKFLGKNEVDEILNGGFKKEKPEERECAYILIEIIQNDLFETTFSHLIEYSNDKNLVLDIYGTIIVLATSKVLWNKNKDINIKNIINEYIYNIPENIKENIRCVYGIDNAKIGLFGTNNRLTYMFY
jgi:hypothetical protein